MKYNTATPYAAVTLIFRKSKKVAFLLRSNTSWMNGKYHLPGGKVEKGESFTAAAVREGAEEVGVKIRPEDLRCVLTYQREAPNFEWIDIIFEVKKWSGDLHNAEPHMHDELVWIDSNNLPSNIVPHVPFMLEQIAAGKTYAEYGWLKGRRE